METISAVAFDGKNVAEAEDSRILGGKRNDESLEPLRSA
jgi:hypothetical protein